jgi:hypothetical protein
MTVLREANPKAFLESSTHLQQKSYAKPSTRPCRPALKSRTQKRHQVLLSAAETPGLTSSVQLEPSDEQATSSSPSNDAAVDAVELVSEVAPTHQPCTPQQTLEPVLKYRGQTGQLTVEFLLCSEHRPLNNTFPNHPSTCLYIQAGTRTIGAICRLFPA